MRIFFLGALLTALALAGPALADPPAPLTPEQARQARQALTMAQADKWSAARKTAEGIDHPLPKRLVRWLDYSRAGSGASFEEIALFIEQATDWPQPNALQRRAEEAIAPSTPAGDIIAWFEKRSPLTVDGKTALGAALLDKGERERGVALLREAWVGGTFGVLQERQFLNRFRHHLRAEDDSARLDRLLWDQQLDAARRQILRVDAAHKQLAQARLALIGAKGNIQAALDKIPAGLRSDPGLVFERLRWLRRKEKYDDAIQILKSPPADLVRPDLWWPERALIARKAFQKGYISEAYQIVREHGLREGAGFAEAEWMAGWIALRFLEDKEVAYRHFKHLYETAQTSVTRARGAYWTGRAAEALGQPETAREWYRNAANFVTSYYGQLAAAKFDHEGQWPLPSDPLPSPEDIEAFNGHELAQAVNLLAEADASDLIRPFILRLHELADRPGLKALAAGLAVRHARTDLAVLVARRADREGVTLGTSGWPMPDHLKIETPNGGVSPEKALVLALIRQESGFNEKAVSSAGARGLMQLMPATAKSLAKSLKVPYQKPQQLTANPALNVKLGVAYLGQLLDIFNGSYIMALAAYNAGPGRVSKWSRDNGDPRDRDVDAIDWIEMIPFTETRNYVQRVMESLQVYRRRLGATELAYSLASDLKRPASN